ncbi:hypothetical protein CDAR_439601 [Caerostris darwini]|uniref:Uncharacterized protein n=1 Tax=Caerostris darwini TaxID=1538125 RepID=A0AAV4MHY3_9ARAC|nr:hypothetical protein CDAR_439601 [Caerostris darwini]
MLFLVMMMVVDVMILMLVFGDDGDDLWYVDDVDENGDVNVDIIDSDVVDNINVDDVSDRVGGMMLVNVDADIVFVDIDDGVDNNDLKCSAYMMNESAMLYKI